MCKRVQSIKTSEQPRAHHIGEAVGAVVVIVPKTHREPEAHTKKLRRPRHQLLFLTAGLFQLPQGQNHLADVPAPLQVGVRQPDILEGENPVHDDPDLP